MNLRNHGVHFTAYCFAEDSIIDTNDTELVPARVPAAGENVVRLAFIFEISLMKTLQIQSSSIIYFSIQTSSGALSAP